MGRCISTLSTDTMLFSKSADHLFIIVLKATVPGSLLFWEGGERWSQNYFGYCGRCVWIWSQVRGNFFSQMDPLNLWRGSQVRTSGTPGRPPPMGPGP